MTAKVFVYRNLHKKCYSLRQNGLVFARAGWVLLGGAPDIGMATGFRVSESGRQKVVATKRKNVHAFAWGYNDTVNGDTLYGPEHESFIKDTFRALLEGGQLTQVSYNPYKHRFFFDKATECPVGYARQIFLTPDGVWTLDPKA